MKNKKVKLYHGTSGESYESILANGFNPRLTDSTWECSESDYIYFYNPANFIEHNESDDMESAENMSIERAFENARITAVIQKSQSKYLYVFCVEVDSKDIESDESCENMELACKVSTDKLTSDSIVKVYQADFAYNMSLLYVAGLKDMDYINLDNFSQYELNMMDVLNNAKGLYMDDLFIIEWEEVS